MKAARRRALGLAASILLFGALVMAASATVGSGPKVTAVQREGAEMGNDNVVANEGAVVGPLLSYELVTRHPTKRGNFRLMIDQNGGVRSQRNEAEPPAGQAWAGDLPSEPSMTVSNAEARLRSILDAGHFFEMEEHQVNEAATDGTIRVLRWNGEGGPRTVTVDRARSASFDQIIAELSKMLSIPGM